MKKRTLILLVGLLMVFALSSLAVANLNSFAGSWVNTDNNTRGITALEIYLNGQQISVRAFGSASPSDIDWGTVQGFAYAGSVQDNLFNGAQVISAIYQTNFSQTILLIRPQGNQLNVETLTRFTDGSNRSNYHAVDYFRRGNHNNHNNNNNNNNNNNSGQNTGVFPAPQLLSPANGKVFGHYPRHTHLVWAPVQYAQSYTVQVDYYDTDWVSNRGQTYILAPNVVQNTYDFDFIGAQPGRWRVWVTDSNGQVNQKSPWWEFRYTK